MNDQNNNYGDVMRLLGDDGPVAGLPIIESCNGCGACCREQRSPPGYSAIANGFEAICPEDAERFENLPGEAKREIEEYAAELERLGADFIHPNGGVCIWLDPETKGCRYYEHRPGVCRDTVVLGGENCHGWREKFNVGESG